jgi:hypothetical protein
MPLDIGYREFAPGALYYTRARGGAGLRACFQFLNSTALEDLRRDTYNIHSAS